MSDSQQQDDASRVEGLWEIVARSVHGRLDDMWRLVPSTDPNMAMFMRMGPAQGSMSCHFSPRTDNGHGQASVRLYLDPVSMRRVRDFRSTNPTIELPAGVTCLELIAAEDPEFNPGPYHVQESWKGMGMLCTLATIVSPAGPELYSRLGPWFAHSLEAIWNHIGAAVRWSNDQETKQAEELRAKANEGDTESQYRLGKLLLSPNSLYHDEYEGFEWMRKAAEAGLAVAQNDLGHCYASGHGVDEDTEEAARWWRKAAEQSHVYSAYCLGNYLNTREEPDFAEALRWLKFAADGGLAEAQHEAGNCYLRSEAASQSSELGISYLEKSAEAGFVPAMEDLANLFSGGELVPKDARRSFKWLLRACEAGSVHSSTQCRLGESYENGEGVDQDFGEAARWYREAASTIPRSITARVRLGNLYFHGRGVKRSVDLAIESWKMTKVFVGIDSGPCKSLEIEVRKGHLLAVSEDGTRRIVDTGCRRSVSLETVDARVPGTAEHLRGLLGEDVVGIIGNDILLAGSGLVIDLRDGDRGMLWIPNPGAGGPSPRLLKLDVEIAGVATLALLDTGAQYSYIRKLLSPTGHIETARDFSVYTGKLEHFDIKLHALPVRVGDRDVSVRFGNLPASIAEKAFERAGADAVIGPELFLGACLACSHDDNLLQVGTLD